MVRWLIAALVYGLSMTVATAGVLKATIDKNPAMQGEIIVLQVQYDAKVSGDSIDFSSLTQDFRVNGPSIQQSMQIFGGQSSQTTMWSLYLQPKATGKYTIPAFKIGNDSSAPIDLEVIPATTTGTNSGAKIFVEAQLEPRELYVQQVGYYSLKIYLKGELQTGSITAPTIDGATLAVIGSDIDGSEIVNGERFHTITRRYSVVPQRSGDLTIASATFNAEIRDEDEGFSSRYVPARAMSAQTEPIPLQVKPIASGLEKQWLVSSMVTLTEEWSGDTENVVQGEPLTRIVKLSAVDLYDHQLPDLKLDSPTGLKQYPEKPQGHTVERDRHLVAQKIFSVAVIAESDGELQLPEIQIPWWNSRTHQAELAVLPARTLKVAANPNQVKEPVVTNTPPTAAEQPHGWFVDSWQVTYSTVTALVLCLAALFYPLSQWLSSQPETEPTTESDVRFNERRFQMACQSHDLTTCQAMLLRWGRQFIHERIQDLAMLDSHLIESPLKQQLQLLRFQQYQREPKPWQGGDLYAAFKQYRHPNSSINAASLPSLYPPN